MPKLVDHEARRERIAHAACQVVADHGFEHASMVRIAHSVGYSTGMVAHYFASKEDIILAALRLILQRMEQRLTQGGEPGNDLLAVLSESLPLDATRRSECAFWTAFWGTVSTDRRVRRLNAGVHREYVMLFRRCIATHWPRWHQWPARVRADVLRSVLTFINGLTASAVTSPADWPPKRQVEQLALQLQLLHQWASSAAPAVRQRRVRTT